MSLDRRWARDMQHTATASWAGAPATAATFGFWASHMPGADQDSAGDEAIL